HGPRSVGAVYAALPADGAWSTRKLANLGAAPEAIATERAASVLVLTTKALLRVTATEAVEEAAEAQHFEGLYPNSLAVAGSGVYVGMRHFVVRLTTDAGKTREEWFVPR